MHALRSLTTWCVIHQITKKNPVKAHQAKYIYPRWSLVVLFEVLRGLACTCLYWGLEFWPATKIWDRKSKVLQEDDICRETKQIKREKCTETFLLLSRFLITWILQGHPSPPPPPQRNKKTTTEINLCSTSNDNNYTTANFVDTLKIVPRRPTLRILHNFVYALPLGYSIIYKRVLLYPMLVLLGPNNIKKTDSNLE